LEGPGTLWVTLQDLFFWLVSATFVADTSQIENSKETEA